MSDIEEDVRRCEKLTEPQNANWIGLTNQLAIAGVLAERKQDKARIQELQDMLKEKDKEIEKKDKIIEQINKDIEANIYLAESNYNIEELNDYARGVYDTYINMRMQYFERKARDERD